MFNGLFCCNDHQQDIKHLLNYKMNPKHKVVEHIEFMCNWLFRFYMHGVHKFYIEQQMKIVFDSLLEEWNQVRQSLKNKFSALDFNTLTNEMLIERVIVYHYGYTKHMSKRKKIGFYC